MEISNQELLKKALSQLGVEEIMGSKHNAEVLRYYADCGVSWVNNDETPWCAAFVGSMLYRCEIEGTGKLNARSYENWGADVTVNPKIGDVVVLWRQNPTSWKGHVGFFMNMDEKYVYLLGGNQGNKVCIARYNKNRILSIRSKSV